MICAVAVAVRAHWHVSFDQWIDSVVAKLRGG
jgi:hypothetical protein